MEEKAPASGGPPTNRLAHEKSPYLLQHAQNPVDWYPWGPEALQRAKDENKPIFLSVGYSTCHWCHVMERESFENEDIGELMSSEFVCIKVDREERPDVDKIYMTYIQLTTGGGGWPMSVFLTPDLKPIVGGTYFAPTDRYGRPGFATILTRVATLWKRQREKAQAQGDSLADALRGLGEQSAFTSCVPGMQYAKRCFDQLEGMYDQELGGFGGAPKFPCPVVFEFLFRFYRANPEGGQERRAKEMALHTLRAMADGGMHDHVGLGFHRYSVDRFWHVPHFEKMLYDQGQLAAAYADAYELTGETTYKEICENIIDYVLRDLTDPKGGFYCGEDADSLPTHTSTEKKEGAFCVWTYDEVKDALGDVETAGGVSLFDVFAFHFDVQPEGNVDSSSDPHGELTDKNVLHVVHPPTETAAKFSLPVDALKPLLADGLKRLGDVRKTRLKPHRDDKILVSWNGLMIGGLSRAGKIFGNRHYLDAAERAAEFIRENMAAAGGDYPTRVWRSYREGPSAIPGFADDYAFLIGGLLDLHEATGEVKWREWAGTLQTTMDQLFWDQSQGGYWGAAEAPDLLCRFKEDYDGAEPSPNSMAALNLQRLQGISNIPTTGPTADRVLQALGQTIEGAPVTVPLLLKALINHHTGTVNSTV